MTYEEGKGGKKNIGPKYKKLISNHYPNWLDGYKTIEGDQNLAKEQPAPEYVNPQPEWPFGGHVTPAQYAALSTEQKEAVIDVILSFLSRREIKSQVAN